AARRCDPEEPVLFRSAGARRARRSRGAERLVCRAAHGEDRAQGQGYRRYALRYRDARGSARRMIRRLLLLALGFALALPLGTARAADHIRVGVVHSLGPAPVFIAAGKGYFAEQGLDAELVFFESAQPVATAAAAGDIDFGCTGMTAAFLTLTAQGSLKIIGAGTWEHQGFQSIGFLISNQAYDAGVKGFKDFGGHSVGITQRGSPLDHDLGRVLEKYSVPLAIIRVLPLQSNQNVASALIGGQADAAVQTAANVYALVNKNQAHLLG